MICRGADKQLNHLEGLGKLQRETFTEIAGYKLESTSTHRKILSVKILS